MRHCVIGVRGRSTGQRVPRRPLGKREVALTVRGTIALRVSMRETRREGVRQDDLRLRGWCLETGG